MMFLIDSNVLIAAMPEPQHDNKSAIEDDSTCSSGEGSARR